MGATEAERRMDDLGDEALGPRIHDAYAQIELDEASQERMLANLLAAQGQTMVRPAVAEGDAWQPTADLETGRDASTSGRHRGWRVLLPLAAVLLVALVVVRLGVMGGTSSSEAALQANKTQEAEAPEDLAYEESDAPSLLMQDQGAIEAEASRAEELGSVDLYPLITLANGVRLTALPDGMSTVEVDPSEIGPSLGPAKAAPFDSDTSVSCEAFEIVGRTDAYAVRFEGEDRYWLCVPLKF